MSLPQLPDLDNIPTRDEVINLIISSIAMEELGLSHIINAEGEKIQYALGTIPGVSGPEEPITVDGLLELNKSIHKTLDSTMLNQFLLKEKLINALSASVMQGPTGPTGPQGPATIDVDPIVDRLEPEASPRVENIGPSEQEAIFKFGIPRGATGAAGASILDSYANYDELVDNHPTGVKGDAYLAGNVLYVWDDVTESWKDMGSIVGPTGSTGAAGSAILGSYDNYEDFIAEHSEGTVGEAWLVAGNLLIWVEDPSGSRWDDMGSVVGPEGPEGPVGPEGAGIQIYGSYDTVDDLVAEHPSGTPGEVYSVEGVLYYWDVDENQWLPISNLNGPTGPTVP